MTQKRRHAGVQKLPATIPPLSVVKVLADEVTPEMAMAGSVALSVWLERDEITMEIASTDEADAACLIFAAMRCEQERGRRG